MNVAIYDLDKTLVRRATFTPFLLFAAGKVAPWRRLLLPVWVAMMIGYKLRLYDRTSLKTAGMKLMLGNVPVSRLAEVGEAFAAHHLEKAGWMQAVIALVEADRAAGAELAVATAAFEFYANAFARRLGIETVIATKWDGSAIPGGNCYGEEKRKRVLDWLGERAKTARIRFVSDSLADKPLLEISQEPIFVTTSSKKKARAEALGWTAISGD